MPNLKEALRDGNLEEFIAEHEHDPPGDERKLDAILRRAAGTSSEASEASSQAPHENCTDTRTRRRTSEGASPRRGRGSRGSKA